MGTPHTILVLARGDIQPEVIRRNAADSTIALFGLRMYPSEKFAGSGWNIGSGNSGEENNRLNGHPRSGVCERLVDLFELIISTQFFDWEFPLPP